MIPTVVAPRNWSRFQHYKDRSPAWIKLHRELLNDREYMMLPLASMALAPCIWLLAAEHKSGHVATDLDELAWRLRRTREEIGEALEGLLRAGLLVDASKNAEESGNAPGPASKSGDSASTTLAPRSEPPADASLEKRREEKRREESAQKPADEVAADAAGESFGEFWEAYRKKVDREAAFRRWKRMPKKDREAAIAGVPAYVESTPDKAFRKNPATWLNNRGWESEIVERKRTNRFGRPATGAVVQTERHKEGMQIGDPACGCPSCRDLWRDEGQDARRGVAS